MCSRSVALVYIKLLCHLYHLPLTCPPTIKPHDLMSFVLLWSPYLCFTTKMLLYLLHCLHSTFTNTSTSSNTSLPISIINPVAIITTSTPAQSPSPLSPGSLHLHQHNSIQPSLIVSSLLLSSLPFSQNNFTIPNTIITSVFISTTTIICIIDSNNFSDIPVLLIIPMNLLSTLPSSFPT